MTVLHILEATRGGTRRHVLDLLPALQSRGVQCQIIYSGERNPDFARDAAALNAMGVVTAEVPMARGWGGTQDMAALYGIRRHVREHRPDIIHCHSTKAGFLGRLSQLHFARRVPVVYTPHCLAFATGLPIRQRRAARLVETLLAPLTAHYIAVAHHEARTMLRAHLAPPPRISTIHNGVDLETFDALSPHHPTTPPPHYLTIGCFGRLTRQKNQAALVHALPKIQKQVSKARVLLVGGGEDEAHLRHLARRLHIEDSITWQDEVDEARPFYAHCDIVAQPSRWEACPYSVLEAMSARRPIVAARVGGVPELLEGGAGQLYKPSCNVDCLTENVLALAADADERAHLGAAARRRVEAEFTLEQMVERTMAVYQNL